MRKPRQWLKLYQSARTTEPLATPEAWSALSDGELVQQRLQKLLNEWWPQIFGYHLLKIGQLSASLDASLCAIPHHITLDATEQSSLQAELNCLPFQEKSIDVVLLAHTLDFYQDPHALLREIDRILVDDGYLFIAGFNPVSILGLKGLMPWKKKRFPWSGRWFHPYRVKDWLQLMNFDVKAIESSQCLSSAPKGAISTWFEACCPRWMSPFRGHYLMVAQKRTWPITPVRQKARATKRSWVTVGAVSSRVSSSQASSQHKL